MKYPRKDSAAFSMIEMLVVLTVTGILFAFVAPTFLTLKSASLSTAASEFGGFLNFCRSKAISDHTSIRLGIVVNSPESPDDNFRKYAAWKWDKRTQGYTQFSGWKFLPPNIGFDDDIPEYTKEADYATEEKATIAGDYVMTDQFFNEVDEELKDGYTQTIRYLTFSPAGRASVKGGDKRNLILVMRGLDVQSDYVTNWCQFTVDSLTGRSRIFRP